ncbi:hypothetical protein [Variovorax sp. MHTC-1]|uniref:hypothetical protein n=1 Tax=Variovorax sp. MHTC-1 TaxID=2495593 RepID=UPI000F89136A|nr:hypothetical protein [Variovorax sp. MHTC-1]RST53292.1 hypothetical protein EJI01_15075 [Variovorax sp. MHTC-1]
MALAATATAEAFAASVVDVTRLELRRTHLAAIGSCLKGELLLKSVRREPMPELAQSLQAEIALNVRLMKAANIEMQ